MNGRSCSNSWYGRVNWEFEMSEDGGVVEWQAPPDTELTRRVEAGSETPLRSLADLRRA